MRAGLARFSLIAAGFCGVEVDPGNDFVIFISRPLKIVKMPWTDNCRTSIPTRRLKEGKFERFCAHDNCQQRRFARKELL